MATTLPPQAQGPAVKRFDLLFQVFQGDTKIQHFGILNFSENDREGDIIFQVIEFLCRINLYEGMYSEYELSITGTKGKWDDQAFSGYVGGKTLAEQNVKHFSVMRINAIPLASF
ncbi:hypothetical protein GGI18_005109 [Coemansia linderi]|uniref:Uncharacterized protein n=1 Tax=Coemansia linderi TaxID=2663919 RepID=A0ACC1K0V2_9FUNG|nr:hypothetical protein GGI18_005109 [Coemansia linderi]